MSRILTVSYDKSNKDISVMCVAEHTEEHGLFSTTVIKMFTEEKAERLFKELTEDLRKLG